MDYRPHISVVIPTCNRPTDVGRVLESLAAVVYPSWDVMVLDQSDDGQTRGIVEDATHRLPNLRYRHLDQKGCSLARNAGLEQAQSDIVAFLDDDCTVGANWLTEAADVLSRHPRAGLVLGELRAAGGAAEWSDEGFTPVRHFDEEFEAGIGGSIRQRLRIWGSLMGNGACMVVRRDVVRHVGTFDLRLGGGGRFPACEDGDYVYRVLMAGVRIVGAPTLVADHYGLRDYKSGAASRHLQGYTYATGAWFMKVLRLGDPCALYWMAQEYRRAICMLRPVDALLRRRPAGMVPLVWLTRGLIDSFELAIDRKRKLYAS